MATLDHIATKVDNITAENWVSRCSVSSATAVGRLLIESTWIFRKTLTHVQVARIYGVDNHEEDVASRLAHLNVTEFTCHLSSKVPQKEP